MRMNAALQAYWITHPLQIQNAGWQHSVHAGGVCSVSSVEQMICLCWHRSKWVLQKVPSIKNKQRPSLHEFWSNNSHSHLQSNRTFSENVNAHFQRAALGSVWAVWMQPMHKTMSLDSNFLYACINISHTSSQGGLKHFGVEATSWSSVNERCVCTSHVRRCAPPKKVTTPTTPAETLTPCHLEKKELFSQETVWSLQSDLCCVKRQRDVARCK